MKEYQRLEQRNKIGLSTTKIRQQKDEAQKDLDDKARAFIEQNIKRKELNELNNVEKFQTNAFGKIRFVNCPASKPAQYIRLANDTDMKHVKMLVEDVWGMLKHKRKPNLVISVIGGAKHFNLHGKKRDAIKEAILAAAKPTNAWLVTEGINMGCSKLIGEIVKEGQYYIKDKDRSLSKMTRGLKAIGICSWGFLAKNEVLVNNENFGRSVLYDSKSSEYSIDNCFKTDNSLSRKTDIRPSLDPNHTHFLLVDNGKKQAIYKRDITKLFYGDFLNLLSSKESKSEERGGLDIPVITLLIEGGTTSIEKLHDSLERKIPCVIMEGSGRAADIVAYALNNTSADKTRDNSTNLEIEKMIKESFPEGKTNTNRRQDIINMIFEIVEHENSKMITIINLNKEEEDRDKKILFALLSTGNFSLKKQMWFTLRCNRADIANELLSNNVCHFDKLKATEKKELMINILKLERVEFLELFVDNDYSFNEFLDVPVLKELYNTSAADHPEIKKLFQKHTDLTEGETICLEHVHQFIKVFMWDHRFKPYENDKSGSGSVWFGKFESGLDHLFDPENQKEIEEKIDDPDFELFIWAVLSNKPELAEFFLTRTKQPLLSLLFAAAYHKRRFSTSNRSNSYMLQDKANDIMEIAFEHDADIALALLDKKYPRFGGETLKSIALNANLKNFLANSPCKESIRSQWRRGFSKINSVASIFAIFLPILVLIPWSPWTPLFKFLRLGDVDGSELKPWQKIFVFYRAPIVKYICHVISSIFLLLLYSFVALFYFGWEYNRYDSSLFLLISIYMIYEIREVFNNKCSTFRGKLKNHFAQFWNKLDLAIYLIFIGSFVLKQFLVTFMVARGLFAINGFLLYVRLLRVYHISFSLGPKLIIFQKMMPHLKTFLVLIIVFILGYGMASQALITPGAKFRRDYIGNFSLVNDILFVPYWQMYGELNLDLIDDELEAGDARPQTRSLKTSLKCTEEDISGGYCEDFTRYNYAVKAMLGVYMLIGNVMLLNMLIAIFSHIFEKVEKYAKTVWWYELYFLVDEYDQMPGLGPIFFPFELVYKIIMGLRELCFCTKKGENIDEEKDFESQSYFTEKFELFEKDSLNTYMKRQAEKHEAHFETKVMKKVEKLIKMK